jgi:hypothetical protein
MISSSRIETETEIDLIKRHVLLPILLDMLHRDLGKMKELSTGIIFGYVAYDLNQIEQLVLDEVQRTKKKMQDRYIKVLSIETSPPGIDISYKIGGYTHQYLMLRSLVKAEIFTLFGDIWYQLSIAKTSRGANT